MCMHGSQQVNITCSNCLVDEDECVSSEPKMLLGRKLVTKNRYLEFCGLEVDMGKEGEYKIRIIIEEREGLALRRKWSL